MELDLRKLNHFVALAEELNFTRAAERLGTGQQAVSASIRRLEAELDVCFCLCAAPARSC
jgi:DNA-binding transcriptional LysR family regulator